MAWLRPRWRCLTPVHHRCPIHRGIAELPRRLHTRRAAVQDRPTARSQRLHSDYLGFIGPEKSEEWGRERSSDGNGGAPTRSAVGSVRAERACRGPGTTRAAAGSDNERLTCAAGEWSRARSVHVEAMSPLAAALARVRRFRRGGPASLCVLCRGRADGWW